jgi:hypothetical protein
MTINARPSMTCRAFTHERHVYRCVAVNCVGSAASETVLKITSSSNTSPPKVLVGMNDVRHKIGTNVEFYVKGIINYNDESFFKIMYGHLCKKVRTSQFESPQ